MYLLSPRYVLPHPLVQSVTSPIELRENVVRTPNYLHKLRFERFDVFLMPRNLSQSDSLVAVQSLEMSLYFVFKVTIWLWFISVLAASVIQ